jgi:hypothetical protein
MIGLLCFVLAVLASPFKSKLRLEAENVVLRHQLIVLTRRRHGRVRLTNHDRLFFIQLYRWFPAILKVLTIIRPETLARWHRVGFSGYWRWTSRPRGGRPQIDTELRHAGCSRDDDQRGAFIGRGSSRHNLVLPSNANKIRLAWCGGQPCPNRIRDLIELRLAAY